MSYITASDLSLALNPVTYGQIFDDNRDGVVPDDDPAVVQVIARAHAMVVSRLPAIYHTLPAELPSVVPSLLSAAELEYATAYAFQRHPEYSRTVGDDKRVALCYSRGDAIMKDLQEAILRLADVPPEAAPANVGVTVMANGPRMTVDDATGQSLTGDF